VNSPTWPIAYEKHVVRRAKTAALGLCDNITNDVCEPGWRFQTKKQAVDKVPHVHGYILGSMELIE